MESVEQLALRLSNGANPYELKTNCGFLAPLKMSIEGDLSSAIQAHSGEKNVLVCHSEWSLRNSLP